ncbi:hypothetical protein GXM_03907 [Nostoc sphaeroides CCNUC1]|uniref:Uncharacterized protein n=1 Tax=Nostoc sphaeroides CCNUC1 TaxID=2653204 RepID=A0A5P8W2D8_9NOSO|nr:hypothetical protein GXM_03907 [Nostoc sphaeroides CCNUC1]
MELHFIPYADYNFTQLGKMFNQVRLRTKITDNFSCRLNIF